MKNKSLVLTIYITLFCCYIFPSGLFSYGDYRLSKLIFMVTIGLQYLHSILTTKKISKEELFMLTLVLVFLVISKNPSFLSFVPLIYLVRLKPTLSEIKEVFNKTNILYFCLILTFIYSIIYSQMDDNRNRFAFTAIREINQSGLSIFCLGCLLFVKNKKIGIITFVFGLLTFSRSYYLALICMVMFYLIRKTKTYKFLLRYGSYLNLTIISSVLLVLMGYFYFHQYRIGNIVLSEDNVSRLFNLLDYSNLFRFQANILLLLLLKKYPKYILTGISDKTYNALAPIAAKGMRLPYRPTASHNLFFSHLKKYGLFSVVETFILSYILKDVVTKENFGIFIAIFLYSILLGAGLYSYWLYLTVFTLSYFTVNIEKTSERKKN